MNTRTRPATSDEAAEDYRLRRAALDAAIELGLYSPAQTARAESRLEEFVGYPRPIDSTRSG